MTFMTPSTDEILQSESSDCVEFIVNVNYTCPYAASMELATRCESHAIFMKWAVLMVTILTSNTQTVMEVLIFRGGKKNDSKNGGYKALWVILLCPDIF